MKINPIAKTLLQERKYKAYSIPNKKKYYADKLEKELDDLWHCRDLEEKQDEQSEKISINKRSKKT